SITDSSYVSRPIAIKAAAGQDVKDVQLPPPSKASITTKRRQSIALREGRSSRSERTPIDSLKTASQSRLAVPRLDLTQSAGQMSTVPAALSPSLAILPWLTILNPSNPKKSQLNPKNQF